MLSVIIRGTAIAEELFPEVSGSSQEFWNGVKTGELQAQRCNKCQRFRFPSTPVCPHCGHGEAEWQKVEGGGRVFSWIRYHKAYLPTYVDVPYTVITAELDEGFRMYGRLLDTSGGQSARQPSIGEQVHAVVEEWANGHRTIAFRESMQSGEEH
jgi:uncharacterized OB-fold protein